MFAAIRCPAAIFFAAVSICSSLVAQPVQFDEEPLRASDPRIHSSDLLRVSRLGDAMLFVASRTALYEPHAMIGFIVEHESDVAELHATDYLPADVVAPRSVGQIYGAALLENGRLALSIGWTNAKSRNINGIAILKRELGGWHRDRVIVMPGSVRDLASGPDNTVLAVATDVDRNRGNGVVEVVSVDPASGIRSRLYDRWLSIEQAEEEALQIRLQRMPGRSVAVFDVAAGTMRLLSIQPLPTCNTSMKVYRDDGLFYPSGTASNCDSAIVRRLLSLTDVPAEARALSHLTIDAVRLHADGSLTVARHGYDGVTTQLVVTRYGKVSVTRRVAQVAAQSAVIDDDFVEAVIMDRTAPKRVSIPIK